MSVNFEVVCIDPEITLLERQTSAVRGIREILPFVLGKYGIARSDCRLEVTTELPQGFDYSI